MESLKKLPYAEYAALYTWAVYYDLYDAYTLQLQLMAGKV